MTFEQVFALFIVGCVLVGALVLYAVHRATRQKVFEAVRAELALHRSTSTAAPKHRRDAHPLDRVAAAPTGGAADFPDIGRHHRSAHLHARAA